MRRPLGNSRMDAMKMAQKKQVLAFDFGASSGRAMLGSFDGNTISYQEIHRFSNDPVSIGGTLYWDVLRQFYEIKQGIVKAKQFGPIDSIAIDTWGVDFGLIAKDGTLLENPVHYRDLRTTGLVEKSFSKIPKEEFYHLTGNQFMELNTVFQLYSLALNRPYQLERADCLLLMPDLFNYMLTGVKASEYTNCTTTQLLDAAKGTWSQRVTEALGIPSRLFTAIVQPGTVIGRLNPETCNELGVDPIKVVSVASHDTASAVAAVPAEEKDFIFNSCGTWSIFGTVVDSPVLNEKAVRYNLANEGAAEGKTALIRNILGLWMIQESRRQYQREGFDYSYGDLERLALREKPFACFIDPDDPMFVPPGNLPRRVREFCEKTSQPVPETVGQVMRCIYESLAMKYRYTYEQLKDCTGKDYRAIHMIGGGTKDSLLCQMTANACGCTVTAGPIEATVLGNIAMQLIANGQIRDVDEARQIIARSEKVLNYQPTEAGAYRTAYEIYLKALKLS